MAKRSVFGTKSWKTDCTLSSTTYTEKRRRYIQQWIKHVVQLQTDYLHYNYTVHDSCSHLHLQLRQ